MTGESMIAKYQKPPFPWEFYIAREVISRVGNDNMVSFFTSYLYFFFLLFVNFIMNYFQVSMFMNIDQAYIFKNCSVLLSVPVEYGDLLSVINKIKQVLLLMPYNGLTV